MKNHIFKINDKNYKVFGFNNNQIILSSKNHKTFESLTESIHKAKIFESLKIISIESLIELVFNEKDKKFSIKYIKEGKVKKELVYLSDFSKRDLILSEIADLKDLQKSIVKESKTKPMFTKSLIIIGIFLVTYTLMTMAIDVQNGEQFVAKGRRKGIQHLMATISEILGVTGITILAILGVAYMIFDIYKRYNNPAFEVVYK